MTATEQDDELREQITPLVIEAIENDLFDGYYGDEICDDTWHFMHSIITAYGKRVALEARMSVYEEMYEHDYINYGLYVHYIAQLKAQQEEV